MVNSIKILSFISTLLIFSIVATKGQTVTGIVKGKGIPVPEVVVKSAVSKNITKTDINGYYHLAIKSYPDTLVVTHMGFETKLVPITSANTVQNIVLNESVGNLTEVEINTGLYKLPLERSTGSFTLLDKKTIERSVSTNIIDRLEGVANGVNFDRRAIARENNLNRNPEIKVHGINTIESNSAPLIILDNFPYEGNLSTINPSDVESITILKDAAAASIWGARAGNGVIVITSKQGKYQQKTRISFLASANVINKPDLYYNPNFLPSATVMEFEEELFKRGAYRERPQTAIPLFVELLIKKRDGLNESEYQQQRSLMEQTDVRKQALKDLYQTGLNQQYAINANGGGDNYRYFFSAGYDANKEMLIGNKNDRITLNLQNTIKVGKDLKLTGSVRLSDQKNQQNGIYLSSLSSSIGGISPYTLFTDANNNSFGILKDYRYNYQEQAKGLGLLDWIYKPIEERTQREKEARNTEIRVDGTLKYTFLDKFNLTALYQYIQGNGKGTSYYAKDSYYVRNLVNKFTKADGTLVIPNNAIFEGDLPNEYKSYSGRLQLNYQNNFSNKHEVSFLAGAEIRDRISESLPGFRLFNYDPNTLTGRANFDYTAVYTTKPSGSSMLPALSQSHLRLQDRFLSYYANASDTYLQKYILSGSIRKDASNIFGVNTNQKGVPLWSAGGGWELSKEDFFKFKPIAFLRLRMTYGSSGNVNNAVSVFPTAIYGVNSTTQLNNAALTSAGNPNIRWEKVNTLNFGMDASLKGRRVNFGLEYYIKKANDLIGIDFMDPTTGIIDSALPLIRNKINYANMDTRGVGLTVNTDNLSGELKWQTTVLFNYVRNKVTHFNTSATTTILSYLDDGSVPPTIGRSKDLIYALPWNGLDGQTGLPLIYMNGNVSTDYANYYTNYLKPGDLVNAGVTSPPYFGSIRNSFSYRGFNLAALVTWKAGYVFRRTSMESGVEWRQTNVGYHMDYFKRWKTSGDERLTNVPATTANYDSYIGYVYSQSAALITKGDHIRLQDIEAGYTVSNSALKKIQLRRVKLFMYARNIGVLWRANKNKLDPDFPLADYPSPRTVAFGLQADF